MKIVELRDELVAIGAITDPDKRYDMINEWFKQHVQQLGADNQVSRIELLQVPDKPGFMLHLKRRLYQLLLDGFLEMGLGEYETARDQFNETHSVKVWVLK